MQQEYNLVTYLLARKASSENVMRGLEQKAVCLETKTLALRLITSVSSKRSRLPCKSFDKTGTLMASINSLLRS